MSGTGGKLFRDYTSGVSTETACDMLHLKTQLASPKPDIVAQISTGDVLDIDLGASGDQLVALALFNGQVVGGIASPKVMRLIACIQDGTNYTAIVTAKNGGQVSIRVSPVKQG